MKKTWIPALLALGILFSLAGCQSTQADGQDSSSGQGERVSFGEGQLYAVAYLGYEDLSGLEGYADSYLESDRLPIHYVSGGEYYLIIPRYDDMELRLYKNDMETMGQTLIFESPESRPFVVQCNVSDIFPDVTISLTRQSDSASFSPYLSLKDGSLQVGDKGLDLAPSQ